MSKGIVVSSEDSRRVQSLISSICWSACEIDKIFLSNSSGREFFTESIRVRLDCSLSDEYMIVQRLSVYSVSFISFHKGLS